MALESMPRAQNEIQSVLRDPVMLTLNRRFNHGRGIRLAERFLKDPLAENLYAFHRTGPPRKNRTRAAFLEVWHLSHTKELAR